MGRSRREFLAQSSMGLIGAVMAGETEVFGGAGIWKPADTDSGSAAGVWDGASGGAGGVDGDVC